MNSFVEIYSQKLKEAGFPQKYKQHGTFQFYGVAPAASSFLSSALFHSLENTSLLVVAPTNTEAEFLYREALSFCKYEYVYYFPGPEVIPYDYSSLSPSVKRDRIQVLSNILDNKKSLIFTSAIGLLRTVPSPKIIHGKVIEIETNKDFSLNHLIKKLVESGYKREEVCEQFGQFSVKGGILDIFPSNFSDPIRLDFFGDTVEEIKYFDPNTQKSIGKTNKVRILPADEFILSETEKETFFQKLNSFDKKLKRPEFEIKDDWLKEELIPLVYDTVSLLSYFNSEPYILYTDRDEVLQRTEQIQREYESLYEKRKEEIICLPPSSLLNLTDSKSFLIEKEGIQYRLLKPSRLKENELILDIKPVESFRGKIRDVRAKIEELIKVKEQIVLTSSFSAQTERLKSLFAEQGAEVLQEGNEEPRIIELLLSSSKVNLVLSELRNGFVLSDLKLHFWSDNDIFGRAYKRKSRFKKKNSRSIDSFIDLKEGDYIVHVNHGIGRFVKIEKVTISGKIRDFLKLEYAGKDTLFVPLDQISLVQRYIGGSDRPALDTLGKGTWKKRKERVQEAVDGLAEELVLMYSNRMKLQGFQYPKDTIWQEEFEAEFEYEETPDQLSAIEAVKADLESPRPMDRLVCGDVGYGKTEVAIRSAFKVIMAGRQVLFIAPTTILALQHYNTLKERFKNFPIRLDMVSRFRSPKEVKRSIELFSKGELDLLVGTHALLTDSINTKKLGLLIIDEEQRFGVNHKEAIKKMKNLVDVLTMTATPIPRTLHMSLTGIRDLSIIETPPRNRQSVETYVMEDNEEIIKTAIEKELERGGQVFYLYNRVETIEDEARYLSTLLPHVSYGVLHGRLNEEEVEETLIDFNSRKYDVLVTTTIIESGIDMPNVNTMIVKRADLFGLSQLYQIRGRVGRGGNKAYAYLFYPPNRVLTEQAEKRLNTIQEYQELGSGFKVAMRDLEIRGAGNLLGKEQSGDIMEVGFDLYVQMLNEAITRLKGEKVEVEVRTALTLSTNFYIPDSYIQDTKQKIEFYKKLEATSSAEEIDELAGEMEDRFGPIPDEAKTFIILEKIRTLASRLGFESISEVDSEFRFKAGAYFKGDPQKIIGLVSGKSGVYINPKEPTILCYKAGSKKEKDRLSEIYKILQKIE
ncbi:MAG: transcription-repair coupling factor [Leptospiraceae bacterium]|nr:transcription-repair coupling factor [Leptospiraceae bacterium]MCP5503013.1 transcription-repair coupling factor [Leptospiraceae bacterium]